MYYNWPSTRCKDDERPKPDKWEFDDKKDNAQACKEEEYKDDDNMDGSEEGDDTLMMTMMKKEMIKEY